MFLLLSSALLLDACSDADSGSANAAGAAGHAGAVGNEAGAGAGFAGVGDEAGSAGVEPSEAGAAGSVGEAGNAGEAGSASSDAGASSGGSSGSSSGGSSGGAPPSGRLMIPCRINAVYATVCQTCHSNPTLNDAPFPLVTLLDMQQTALAQYGAISAGSMPKEGALAEGDKNLLLDWLSDGAPGVPEASCP